VSLYNESGGADIDPTPVIGTLGLVDRLAHRPPGIAWAAGSAVVLLGSGDSGDAEDPHPLGASRWAVERRGRRGGTLGRLDPAVHRRLLDLVTDLVTPTVAGGAGPLGALHDVSAGGLAVALAEMAVAGGVGLVTSAMSGPAELFCELPSRVVVATTRPAEVLAAAAAASVPARPLGTAGGDRLEVTGVLGVAVSDLAAAWRGALPGVLGAGVEEVP